MQLLRRLAAAGSASRPAGSRSAARAWSIPTCSSTAASMPRSTRLRVRHGPRAHGDASPRRQRHQVLLRRRHSLPGAVLMKVLWSWLLELCDLDKLPTSRRARAALTRGGIEIEGMTNLGAGFRGVVVAEVVGKRPHPQADKLTLVDVITERGGAATQVVCGAPNVPEPGRKVLWAQIGAELPGTALTLAAKAVKGIESPGMLCAEDELGLVRRSRRHRRARRRRHDAARRARAEGARHRRLAARGQRAREPRRLARSHRRRARARRDAAAASSCCPMPISRRTRRRQRRTSRSRSRAARTARATSRA